MPSSPEGQFVSIEMARGLLQKAAAPAEWNLTAERFRLVLERSVAHRFKRAASSAPSRSSRDAAATANSGRSTGASAGGSPGASQQPSFESPANARSHLSPDARTIQAYLDSLNVADLALACACSEGNPAAWDFFMARFRPEICRAGRAIAGEAAGRELADSLYAELYGLREVAGGGKALVGFFFGG